MKRTTHHSYWQGLLGALFMLLLVSCGSNEKVGSQSLISGATNKTWSASKETNAAGDKEKISKAEKGQTLQFYADGRFAASGGSALETGTWTFDQSGQKLSLNFENQSVTENFDVIKLTDDEMHLKAADGSVMQLSAN